MLINLNRLGFCSDCEKIMYDYLKTSTRIPLSDKRIWGIDTLERNMRNCGCPEADRSSDLEKIKVNAIFHLNLYCIHTPDILYSGKFYLLGYPEKEYILMTNTDRRNFVTQYHCKPDRRLV